MTFSELQDKLIPQDRRLAVGVGLLTPNVDELLARVYDGGPLVLSDAEARTAEPGQCVIMGRSDFLHCAGLETVLTAWVDETGDAGLLVSYRLRGVAAEAGEWKFSHSFPDLPAVDGVPYLDRLRLREAFFTVASRSPAAGDFPAADYVVRFSAKAEPGALFGPLLPLFSSARLWDISGVLIPVDPAQTARPLGPLERPWEVAAAGGYCPGIFLRIKPQLRWALERLNFEVDSLRIYSPPSAKWLRKNDGYVSFFAYQGRFAANGLGIQADFCADYDPDKDVTTLPMQFSGVSLAHLAQLAELCGGCELLGALPAGLQKLPLGRLALTAATLSISTGGQRLLFVSLTVGMPDLQWEIIPNHFCLRSVEACFSISNPFGKSRLSCRIGGLLEVEGVRLELGASDSWGGTLYSRLAQEISLPVRPLLRRYLPQVEVPFDLSVQELALTVSPGAWYQMNLRMANEPTPWLLDLGFQKLTVRDVFLYGARESEGGVSGVMGGTLLLGGLAELQVLARIPGELVLHARFPAVRLRDFFAAVCDADIPLPKGFDLELTDASILIEASGSAYHLLFGVRVEGFGVLALEVRKTGGKWGAAFGLDLAGGRASRLPALSGLARFESAFSLDRLLLIVSSFTDVGFSFPDMEWFERPELAGSSLTPPTGNLAAGFNFYGRWALQTSDQKQALLRSVLGLESGVDIVLQIGKNPGRDARLYADCQTAVAGHSLRCCFGGRLRDGGMELFLEGSLDVEIQGHIQNFEVTLEFVGGGAYLSATRQSDVPLDFGVFRLGNLAVEAGFSWDGLSSFGLAGTVTSGAFHSSIAAFFDSARPAKSLVAGAVSDLSLRDVLDAFVAWPARQDLAGALDDFRGILEQFAVRGTREFWLDAPLADDLDNLQLAPVAKAFASQGVDLPASVGSVYLTVSEPGKSWFLTDLSHKMLHYQLQKTASGKIRAAVEAQLYCAPQQTQIGALPAFPPGFYINARLVFFGFQATATVEIDANRGFCFEAQMDRLVIFSETLFCVRAARGEGGPTLSAATYGAPHLYINGRVSMLGLEAALFLRANKHGLAFEIDRTFLSAIRLHVHGAVGGAGSLQVGGGVHVELGGIDLGALGALGTLGVDGELALSVDGSVASATLDASFRLGQTDYRLGRFGLDINVGSLAGLPEILWKKVREYVLSLFQDPQSWAYYVANGVLRGVENMITVLCEVFGRTLEAAKEIVEKAFEMVRTVCPITTALQTL